MKRPPKPKKWVPPEYIEEEPVKFCNSCGKPLTEEDVYLCEDCGAMPIHTPGNN